MKTTQIMPSPAKFKQSLIH